jgi:hypothetical protein
MIDVSVSNTLDAPDIKFLKNSLMEYSEIITDTPIFNTNNNQDDIKGLLYEFLVDLYVTEPQEVINFVNQQPSKKFINNLFKQFGISNKISNNYPDLLKTKTAYMLQQLFETKGSNNTYDIFNDIISEFYHDLNFYNVRVEQRKITSKYEQPTVVNKYYLNNDHSIPDEYMEQNINVSTHKDIDINFKVYPTIHKYLNKVTYVVKFYPEERPLDEDTWTLPRAVNFKLDHSDNIIIERGQTEITFTQKHYDLYNDALELTDAQYFQYSTPTLFKMYYVDSLFDILGNYGTVDINSFIDDTLTYTITPNIVRAENRVEYLIEFYNDLDPLWTLPDNVKLQFDFIDEFVIDAGTTSLTVHFNANSNNRSPEQLVYVLEPVLINDPLSIQTEIYGDNLRTSKYLMKRQDYFDADVYNQESKNVFPIITNILYIQFGTSDTVDNMEYLPDLVRMFAMTKTQDDIFTFKIGSLVVKMPMSEYVDMLTFIRLKELEVKSALLGQPWKYGDYEIQERQFTYLLYPKDQLIEIYNLILYYKDMRHEHGAFQEFKRRLNALLGQSNQLKTTKIFNIEQFHEHLAGNVPETFEGFFVRLEEFYRTDLLYDDTHTSADRIANQLLLEKVTFIYETYTPTTTKELFNLIAMDDEEYTGLNSSVYDILKNNFVDKYPRVVQAIEAMSSPSEFIDLYLNNYKRMLVETVKEDNFVTYFVNDLFKRYLLSSTFKEEFFDPVMDMFQQYFFKAELSYQNADSLLQVIRDKMQRVTCGTSAAYQVRVDNTFSEHSTLDDMGIHQTLFETNALNKTILYSQLIIDYWVIKNADDTYDLDGNILYKIHKDLEAENNSSKTTLDDNYNIVIVNDVTGIHNFTEDADASYINGNKI